MQRAGRSGTHQEPCAQLDQLVDDDAGAAAAHAGCLHGDRHSAVGAGESQEAARVGHLAGAVQEFLRDEPGAIGVTGTQRAFGLIAGGGLQMECHAARQTTHDG